jgi:gliding motility-associated lipoprotein GldH
MTEGLNKITLLLYVVVTFLVCSCNSNVIFTDSVLMEKENWALDNVPVFTPSIKDTLSSNNIYFTLRTGSSYPFRNIYFFVSTTSPAGKTITDTLQYILADEKGKWYGKGSGDIHEMRLPFKTNVYFPARGTYSFKVRHGMRNENLNGVYDIGLRIEKIKIK